MTPLVDCTRFGWLAQQRLKAAGEEDHMGGEVAISLLNPATRLLVRGGEAAIPLIGRAFGVALPRDACRAAVSARFSVDRMADQYLELYRSLFG